MSLIMMRYTTSARRRFRQRMASLWLPPAVAARAQAVGSQPEGGKCFPSDPDHNLEDHVCTNGIVSVCRSSSLAS